MQSLRPRKYLKFLSLTYTILSTLTLLTTRTTYALDADSTRNTSGANAWEGQELGKLCESDNDLIGRSLGCNCDNLTGGILTAQCSERRIGLNNTLALPQKLNISRHVRIADFSKNEITILDENTFGDCEGVSSMTFYKNHIKEVSGLSCKRLEKLDLSWNHIKKLTNSTFKNLSRLQELDLSFNNLIVVESAVFKETGLLRILNLASNPLGEELNEFEDYVLSLENLEFLEQLDLSNTTLPDFPQSLINGTKNLKHLKLKNNQISYLPQGLLHQMTKLERLDLSGNLFETLSPFGFLGLRSLNLLIMDKMSFLHTIDQHAFAGLVSLKELSCQKNHFLTFIDPMAFRGSTEIEEAGESHPKVVRLGDNNLNSIEYGLLIWKDMEMLELYRNPWICDCNLQWVPEFHRAKPDQATILTDSDFNCVEPHIMAGVSVAQVNPEEMLCFSPAATVAGTVGIILFGFLMFSFCSIIILNHMGMLPDWVRQYNIFGSGSSLPKYMRVNPKPTRARRLERQSYNPTERSAEPVPGDLEWDTGDIGRIEPT